MKTPQIKLNSVIDYFFFCLLMSTLLPSVFLISFSVCLIMFLKYFLKCQQITVVCAFLVGAKSSPVLRQIPWLFKQNYLSLGLQALSLLTPIPSSKSFDIFIH